jgi:hypothetical protein
VNYAFNLYRMLGPFFILIKPGKFRSADFASHELLSRIFGGIEGELAAFFYLPYLAHIPSVCRFRYLFANLSLDTVRLQSPETVTAGTNWMPKGRCRIPAFGFGGIHPGIFSFAEYELFSAFAFDPCLPFELRAFLIHFTTVAHACPSIDLKDRLTKH